MGKVLLFVLMFWGACDVRSEESSDGGQVLSVNSDVIVDQVNRQYDELAYLRSRVDRIREAMMSLESGIHSVESNSKSISEINNHLKAVEDGLSKINSRDEGWSGWVSVLLGTITVIMATLTILIGVASVLGYKKIKSSVSENARREISEVAERELPARVYEALKKSIVDDRSLYDDNGNVIEKSDFQKGLENLVLNMVESEIERAIYRGIDNNDKG